ncbi:MAG TPA: ASKHA domain-containing protein [Patescibacteria group bacterium]|nr:ASKHA domain-containing protein [Patescibacteria group bacterium]
MNELLEHKIWVQGREEPIGGRRDVSLQQTLAEQGLPISADCGGLGSCGKCRIAVLAGDVEGIRVESEQVGEPLYLACRTYPRGDITVSLPTGKSAGKGDLGEFTWPVEQPLFEKVVLRIEYPSLTKHCSLQQAVVQGLADQGLNGTGSGLNQLDVLRQLSLLGESKPAAVTAVFFQQEVIALEAGDTGDCLYGVAFDIGTTTVAGMLVDLRTNKLLAVCSRTNPQISFGADVISRIRVAQERVEGLAELAQVIRQCLNQVIAELCVTAAIEPAAIYGATIVGNTTMIQLLLSLAPSSLAQQPYAALFNHLAPLPAALLELNINPQGVGVILPNIASFVGSDTTGAILAVDLDRAVAPALLVDLGTNGEMAIGGKDRLFACSTAAGPAFEGAHIRDGMRAVNGAIQDVEIAGDVTLTVIGDGPPKGICGSGMIKAVAEMLRAGIVSASGRFNNKHITPLPPAVANRLRQQDGQWEFVLVGESDEGRSAVAITQGDIRQIQLVKASICTGIEYLLERAGLSADLPLHLAGAFGNYVDVDSACRIGMFPGIAAEQILAVGNAAAIGGMKALTDQKNLWRGQRLIEKVEYVELAAQPDFQQRFLQNLQLGTPTQK